MQFFVEFLLAVIGLTALGIMFLGFLDGRVLWAAVGAIIVVAASLVTGSMALAPAPGVVVAVFAGVTALGALALMVSLFIRRRDHG